MAQVNLSMDSHGVNTFIDVDHYEMERHRMSPNDSIAETSEHDSVRHGNIDLESNNEVLAPSEDHDNILNAPYLTIAPATNQQIDHSGCQDYESTCSFYRRFNEGFDNFYMSFRKYAIYPCIFFWVVGIAFGVNSLAFDSWRRNIVEYTADGVVGISESVIGAYGIERLDNAKVNDEYFITMRRSLSYENILAEGKCAAGEVQQLTEARLLEELLFRSEGKVGNLDPSDQQNFVALHGKSVYDVMRSGIPMMADAGRVIVIMGIMSYVLFCLMTYFVLRRVIYPNGTISGHVNVTIWYIGSVAWSLSLLLGGIGFVVYVCVSGEPCCINAAGTPKICSLYLSSYYFIIYLFSNALCFVAYILNTRVHGVDGSERDHTAM